MKVLLVGTGRRPIPPTGYGGIERYIGDLARELGRQGVEVTIVNGFRADRYTAGWAFERHLPLLLRRSTADIVHVHTSRAALVLGLTGIRYIFSSHTPRWLHLDEANALQRLLFERERLAVRLAESTIAPSSEPLRRVIEAVGSRRGPVTAIPVGVDTETCRATSEGIPHHALGVGVIERRKRWHLAGRALEGTGIDLTVVGPLRDLRYAEELRARGVVLAGEVPESRLLEEFDRASFVVHPSQAETGMAAAPLQAMAFSRPVLGGPAIQGIDGALTCDSNEEGRMVEFLREWAIRLDTDVALRRSVGAAGRRIVESRYSWPRIAEEHLRVYSEALSRRTGSAPSR